MFKIWFVLISIAITNSLEAMILFEDPEIALRMIKNEQAYKQAQVKKRLVETHVAVVVLPQVPSEEDGCSLCFEPYDAIKRTRLSLPCDPQRNITHDFCKPCLVDWQKKSKECPKCRRPFLLEQPSLIANLLRILSVINCLRCCECDG